ncbi:MAG: DUF4097 domain-containing protein [Lachnospiraceae bacterium]|nr:DUF4097 domain-containing protein [Lachnospiraceae bacterium]
MRGLRRVAGVAAACIGIGMIIVIVTFAAGGTRVLRASADNHYSMEEDITDKVKSLDISVAAGKVKIVEGDKFHVSINRMEEDGFVSEVRNGTWYVYNTDDDKYLANFFGIKVPVMYGVFGIGYNGDATPEVIVTVPADYELEDFNVDVSAGVVTINGITAKNAELELSNGELNGERLTVSDEIKIELGAGQVEITEFSSKDTNLESGMGSIYLEGVITGDTYANAGIGQVYLKLDGDVKDYNFNADCSIGAVTINDRSYGGIARNYYRGGADGPSMVLECGIGEVRVSIR